MSFEEQQGRESCGYVQVKKGDNFTQRKSNWDGSHDEDASI